MQAVMDSTSTRNQKENQQQRRKSTGRQKIEIKKVEEKSKRYVTFSKRKRGLFKKATELSTLCGAEVAVIIFSQNEKVFSCGHPDVDKVLDHYIGETDEILGDNSLLFMENNEALTMQEQEYMKLDARLDEEKRVAKMLENTGNMNSSYGGFWWDLGTDNMGKEELLAYKESMEDLKKNVMSRLDTIADSNAASDYRIINQFIHQNEIASNGHNEFM